MLFSAWVNSKQAETKNLKLLKAKPWAADLIDVLYRFEGREVSAEQISAAVSLQFPDWSEAEVSETCILCVDAGLLSLSDRPGMLHCGKLPGFACPPVKSSTTKVATRPIVCSTPQCRHAATDQDSGDKQWYCEHCFDLWEEESKQEETDF